ncbi:zeta toxin family protein [Embleya sp. NPDC059237]|uniref:zeta toxin family protein n=1 Tax=Embleya sp. NPDC059237 TaxID=3346784 RepID=UPI0036B9C70D
MTTHEPPSPRAFRPGREADPGDEEHRNVMARTILPTSTHGAIAQNHPVVVFVAGQPGAGKTAIADLIQAALDHRGGSVRIGADLYKTFHRRYAESLVRDARTAGAKVRADTRGWQAELEAYVRTQGFDAVVETSLADGDAFRTDAGMFRSAGFRVEVLALATSEAWSQLGVLDRYITGAADSCGRYVSWDNHDHCARALPQVLAMIETESLADRLTVVRRDTTLLYTNELDADGSWIRSPAADRAVLGERTRPWTARETVFFCANLADTHDRVHREPSGGDQQLTARRDGKRALALAEPVRRIARAVIEPPGVDYHRLTTAEHTWIFEELIVPDLGEITAHEHPNMYYVMGQPGSGKTRAARLVHRALHQRHPTRIVAENFKICHPDYLQLLQECPRSACKRIRADYQAWREEAKAHVRTRRGDMIVEIAPGSAAAFTRDAILTRQAGYRIELVVVAARPADSRQGTAARYAQADQSGPARFTTVAGHNRCLRAVFEALEVAERDALVDSVIIMRRDQTAVYRNERGPDGRWVRATGAAWALLREQCRPYTACEAAEFLTVQRWLWQALPQHRHELADIAGLAAPLMPSSMRPPSLVAPRTLAELPVPRTLPDTHYGPASSTKRAS